MNEFLYSSLLNLSKSYYFLTFLVLTTLSVPFLDLTKVFAEESVVDTITVGESPVAIAYNPGNDDLYVTNFASNTVSVIDQNNDVVDTITVEARPIGIAYNPDNGDMYVTNQDSNVTSVIDENNNVVDTITVEIFPFAIAYNPGNGFMYVTNSNSGTVSVIDPQVNDVVDTITVGEFPNAIAYNPDNGNLYVTNHDSDTVSVIDQNNDVVDTITVGDTPRGIAYNPGNGFMYVTNSNSGTVSVIDPQVNDVIQRISVDDTPHGIAYNPDNKNMYVTNGDSDTVSVIDQNNDVVDTITVGDFPSGIAYNPGNGNLYVANFATNTISVLGSIVPIANAGPDQTIDSGDLVRLDGSGSSDPQGSTLTYLWTQTDGSPVSLSDSTAANPTFTAPDIQTQEEDIVFQLVVTNEEGIQSEPDGVIITVNPANSPPSPPPSEGILGSGNNVNIQVQENSGNSVAGQHGGGEIYSDSPIFQGQSTEQDTQVIS